MIQYYVNKNNPEITAQIPYNYSKHCTVMVKGVVIIQGKRSWVEDSKSWERVSNDKI